MGDIIRPKNHHTINGDPGKQGDNHTGSRQISTLTRHCRLFENHRTPEMPIKGINTCIMGSSSTNAGLQKVIRKTGNKGCDKK